MEFQVRHDNSKEPITLPVDNRLIGQLMQAEMFCRLRGVCEEVGLVSKDDTDKYVSDVVESLIVGTPPPQKEDAKDKEDGFTIETVQKRWPMSQIVQSVAKMQSIPRNTTPKNTIVIDSLLDTDTDTKRAALKSTIIRLLKSKDGADSDSTQSST